MTEKGQERAESPLWRGHLRCTAESLQAARDHPRDQSSPALHPRPAQWLLLGGPAEWESQLLPQLPGSTLATPPPKCQPRDPGPLSPGLTCALLMERGWVVVEAELRKEPRFSMSPRPGEEPVPPRGQLKRGGQDQGGPEGLPRLHQAGVMRQEVQAQL